MLEVPACFYNRSSYRFQLQSLAFLLKASNNPFFISWNIFFTANNENKKYRIHLWLREWEELNLMEIAINFSIQQTLSDVYLVHSSCFYVSLADSPIQQ